MHILTKFIVSLILVIVYFAFLTDLLFILGQIEIDWTQF